MEKDIGPITDRDWQPLGLRDDEHPSPLSRKNARNSALVLEARGIPFRMEKDERGWHLLVPNGMLPAARRELQLYYRENRGWPPPPPPAMPQADNTLATLCVLLLLATFHNFTLLDPGPLGRGEIDWTALGNAYAGKIRQGEWWRAVTALTLHSDGLHLLGNLAIGGVFIVRLCRLLGGGLGWSLILASGILGNLANALLQSYHHRAVGASTAVFGTVGILAGLSLVRYRRTLWRRWTLPLAGALGLLGLLGTGGENTDIGAHLLGFLFGLPLGGIAALWIRDWGRPSRQAGLLLAMLSAGTVMVAWGAAFAFG